MADPVAEQIVDALKTVLEDMTGTYSPDKVVRAAAFDGRVLDPTLNVIYSISTIEMPETRHALGTTNNVGVDLVIGLALCKRFKGEDDTTGEGAKQRLDEQHKLIKAAGDAIRADRQFGGLALDLTVDEWDVSAENTYVEGWAIAFMRITIMFIHSETAA